jgi:hypothetical protein
LNIIEILYRETTIVVKVEQRIKAEMLITNVENKTEAGPPSLLERERG